MVLNRASTPRTTAQTSTTLRESRWARQGGHSGRGGGVQWARTIFWRLKPAFPGATLADLRLVTSSNNVGLLLIILNSRPLRGACRRA